MKAGARTFLKMITKFSPVSKLIVDIPELLRRAAVEAAAAQGIPLDQLVTLAIAEKLSSPAGRREDFDRFLAAVPDREPMDTDWIA